MPNMFGGPQDDPTYAPHLWIGESRVEGKQQVSHGVYDYQIGRTSDETLVAIRRKENGAGDWETVPESELPQPVIDAVSPTAWANRQREIAGVMKLIP